MISVAEAWDETVAPHGGDRTETKISDRKSCISVAEAEDLFGAWRRPGTGRRIQLTPIGVF